MSRELLRTHIMLLILNTICYNKLYDIRVGEYFMPVEEKLNEPQIPQAPDSAKWQQWRNEQAQKAASNKNVREANVAVNQQRLFSQVVSSAAESVGTVVKKSVTAVGSLFNSASEYWNNLKQAEIEAEKRSGNVESDADKNWTPFAGTSLFSGFISLPWASSMYNQVINWVTASATPMTPKAQERFDDAIKVESAIKQENTLRQDLANATANVASSKEIAAARKKEYATLLRKATGSSDPSPYNWELDEQNHPALRTARIAADSASVDYLDARVEEQRLRELHEFAVKDVKTRQHIMDIRPQAEANAATTTAVYLSNKSSASVVQSQTATDVSVQTDKPNLIHQLASIIGNEKDPKAAVEKITAMETVFGFSLGMPLQALAQMPWAQDVYDALIHKITSPPYAIPLKHVRAASESREALTAATNQYQATKQALAVQKEKNPTKKYIEESKQLEQLKNSVERCFTDYKKSQTEVIAHGEALIAQAKNKLEARRAAVFEAKSQAADVKETSFLEKGKALAAKVGRMFSDTADSVINAIENTFGVSLQQITSMSWVREVYDTILSNMTPLVYGIKPSLVDSIDEADKAFEAADAAYQAQWEKVQNLGDKPDVSELEQLDILKVEREMAFEIYAVLEEEAIEQGTNLINDAKKELTYFTNQATDLSTKQESQIDLKATKSNKVEPSNKMSKMATKIDTPSSASTQSSDLNNSSPTKKVF